MAAENRFDVEMNGDVTVVRLCDPKLHEMILISQLHDELLQFIEQQHPEKLLIDFTMVTQCSSAVINSMLMARKRLMEYDAVVRLCNMHRQVREAFGLLRLDGTLFEIFETLPEGVEAFYGD